MQYNPKINTDGEYRNFYGWTVISMVENDFKFIENFIKKNSLLNQFFSALPSSSYHVTVYNLWCNGMPLLPHQQNFINKNFPQIKNELEKQSKLIGFFNPGGCINDLLYRIEFDCQQCNWDKLSLKMKKAEFNGNTIQIIFEENFDKVNEFRKILLDTCKKNDNLKIFHMTLAYKFTDTNKDSEKLILAELDILNLLLDQQTITLNKPSLRSFKDMTAFYPFIDSLKIV